MRGIAFLGAPMMLGGIVAVVACHTTNHQTDCDAIASEIRVDVADANAQDASSGTLSTVGICVNDAAPPEIKSRCADLKACNDEVGN